MPLPSLPVDSASMSWRQLWCLRSPEPPSLIPTPAQRTTTKNYAWKGNKSNLCFPVTVPEIANDYLHTEQAKSNLSPLLKKKKKKSYYKLHLTQVCIVCQFLSNCKLDQGCLLGAKSGFWNMSYWLGINYLQQICEANLKQEMPPGNTVLIVDWYSADFKVKNKYCFSSNLINKSLHKR